MTCRLPSISLCGLVRGAVNLVGDAIENAYQPSGVSAQEKRICLEAYGKWLNARGENGLAAIHYSQRISGGIYASVEHGVIRLIRPGEPARVVPVPPTFLLPAPIPLIRAPEPARQGSAAQIAASPSQRLPDRQLLPLLAAPSSKRR
jgi:hypothetical protein